MYVWGERWKDVSCCSSAFSPVNIDGLKEHWRKSFQKDSPCLNATRLSESHAIGNFIAGLHNISLHYDLRLTPDYVCQVVWEAMGAAKKGRSSICRGPEIAHPREGRPLASCRQSWRPSEAFSWKFASVLILTLQWQLTRAEHHRRYSKILQTEELFVMSGSRVQCSEYTHSWHIFSTQQSHVRDAGSHALCLWRQCKKEKLSEIGVP